MVDPMQNREGEEDLNTENDRFANHNRQPPQEDTIDPLELVFAILSHWKLLICITVVCAAAAGAYNWFCLEPLYQASSKIYISSTNTVINIQELQLSDELTVDYEEIIRSRTVLKKVIAKLNLNMTYEDLDRMVSISNPKDSHCLNIAVTCSDPNMAVTITNSLVTIGIDQVYRVIGHDEPAIIDPAEVDAVKDVKASLLKYAVLGGMLGAVSVCGLVVIQVLADNTLQCEEDVLKYLDLPVLASIPAAEQTGKTRGRKPKKNHRKEPKNG